MARYWRRLDPRRWLLLRRLRRFSQDRGNAQRLEQFLAVQHYISDERAQFRESLEKLRSRKVGGRDAFVKAKFLPEVLEANLLFSEGDYSGAATGYRDAIAKATREYQRALSMRFQLRERRKLDFLSIVLALLYNNLAEALARADQNSPKILEAFENAIEFQPSLIMLREGLAYHYARRHLWNEAEAAYRDAYASVPTRENEQRLQGNLANLRDTCAETLCDEGKLEEAVDVLEGSLSELSETELDGWKGKTHFGLGRVRRQQGKSADAAAAYERSADLYAKAGDSASASYVTEVLAEVHASDGEHERAFRLLEKSHELARGPEGDAEVDRPRDARLKAKMGILNLLHGRPEEARQALDQSRALWREEGWFEPFVKVVTAASELIDSDEASMRLRLHLQRRLSQASEPWDARDLIGALRRCQQGALKFLLPPDKTTDHQLSTSMLPVVTPLAIEIDGALLKAAGGGDRIVEELAPAMRNRLLEHYGVKIPGIRVRENQDEFAHGTYVLMIHEIPLRSGSLSKDARFYLGEADQLDAAGIPVESGRPMTLRGDSGFWIEEDYWKKASAAQLEPLETLEIPIRDLEDLIAANLVEFVGHQEVQNLLETSQLVGPDGDDIVAKETRAHMDPLTNVVRALVTERVPIADFAHVYALFRRLWTRDVPPWSITEAIRSDPGIRSRLWGNNASFSHFELGPRLMALIDDGVRGVDGTVLALEPEDTQRVLAAVREAISGSEQPAVIVPRQNRRSVMRRLLEIEFPQVPVLAMAELEPGLGTQIRGIVELEPEPEAEAVGGGA